jgi:hypothetical protein
MGDKKRRSRIKQTRTEFQKVFDRHPGMVLDFSWHDRLFEVLHISATLYKHDFQNVKSDFYDIADCVNSKYKFDTRKFHFNLTHTIRLIKKDKALLDKIYQTCFKEAFACILTIYSEITEFEIEPPSLDFEILFKGYDSILHGRSDTSILCKYLMIQYDQQGNIDHFNLFKLNTVKEILTPQNISSTMAMFPTSIGISDNLDLDFCHQVWMFNYFNSPIMPETDSSQQEEMRFKEVNMDELKEQFVTLYSEFCKINLLAAYEVNVAEMQMGFVARICNLSLDIIDLVKVHKGEIAELTIRSALETFITASWLLKRKDASLYQRYRDYSLGREKFMVDKALTKVKDEEIKNITKKYLDDTIKNAGVSDVNIALERGEIFNIRIDQMAEEVWEKDNEIYLLYKRLSEVAHGHWKIIVKYHLSESLNPMHNGLHWYNENPNRFSGLTPASFGLMISTDFLIKLIKDINNESLKVLEKDLVSFRKKVSETYIQYMNKYILNIEG